jgi:hypothetical protein
MDWKRFGRKLAWPKGGTIPVFSWRDWDKPYKISYRITDFPLEIQIEHVQNTSLENYL